MNATELAERIRARSPDVVVARDEATLSLGRDELLETLTALREEPDLSLDFLSCVTATDRPGGDPRFWVAYELSSLRHHHRLRVRVGLSERDPVVPSVTGLFPTADWLERETYDLFGIVFDGHPDLTRILMPEDWEGHPLRKDYEVGEIPVQFKGAPS